MVKMTKDRISKLRCIGCGAKEKRVAILKSGRKAIGFATICCNCGNMHKYVFRDKDQVLDEFNITSMVKGSFTVAEIKCGTKYAFCPNRQCPYWKGEPTKHKPHKNHHHEPMEETINKKMKPILKEEKTVYQPSYENADNSNKKRKEYL